MAAMTEQPTNPTEPAAMPPPVEPRPPTFEERVETFANRAGEAGEKLGREAEAAAERWKKDPSVVGAADAVTRVWGLVVLAVGLWFFADITLGLDMPSVAWRDLWPVVIIVIGLAVLIRGLATRRA
jgi:hypothetical protein